MSSIDINKQITALVSNAVIGVINRVADEISRNDCYCELQDATDKQKKLVFKQVGYCEWLCVNVYRLLFVWCPFLQCLISSTVERCRFTFKKTLNEIQTTSSISLDQLQNALEVSASIPRLAKVRSVFERYIQIVKLMSDEVQDLRDQMKNDLYRNQGKTHIPLFKEIDEKMAKEKMASEIGIDRISVRTSNASGLGRGQSPDPGPTRVSKFDPTAISGLGRRVLPPAVKRELEQDEFYTSFASRVDALMEAFKKVKEEHAQCGSKEKALHDQITQLTTQLKQARESAETLNNQLEATKSDSHTQDEALRVAKNLAADRESTIKGLQQRISELQGERQSTTEQSSRIAGELKTKLEALTAQQQQDQQKITALKQQLDASNKAAEALRDSLQKELSQKNKQMSDLEVELTKVRKEYDELIKKSNQRDNHVEDMRKDTRFLLELFSQSLSSNRRNKKHCEQIKETEYAELKKQYDENEESLGQALAEQAKASEKTTTLQTLVISLQAQLEAKDQEIKLKEDLAKQAKLQEEHAKGTLTKTEAEQLQLKAKIKEIEGERDRAKQESEALQRDLHQAAQKAKVEMEGLQQQLKLKEATNQELTTQLSETCKTKTDLEQKLHKQKSAIENAVSKLEPTLQALTETKEKTEKQMQQLQSNLKTEREQTEPTKEAAHKFTDLEQTHHALTEIHATTIAQRDDLRSELERERHQTTKFQEELEKLRKEFKHHQDQKSTLDHQLTQVIDERDQLKSGSLESLKEINNSLGKERQRHEDRIKELNERIAERDRQLQELEEEQQEVNREIADLKLTNEILTEKAQKSERDREAALILVQRTQEELSKLQQEIISKRAQSADLEKRIGELKAERSSETLQKATSVPATAALANEDQRESQQKIEIPASPSLNSGLSAQPSTPQPSTLGGAASGAAVPSTPIAPNQNRTNGTHLHTPVMPIGFSTPSRRIAEEVVNQGLIKLQQEEASNPARNKEEKEKYARRKTILESLLVTYTHAIPGSSPSRRARSAHSERTVQFLQKEKQQVEEGTNIVGAACSASAAAAEDTATTHTSMLATSVIASAAVAASPASSSTPLKKRARSAHSANAERKGVDDKTNAAAATLPMPTASSAASAAGAVAPSPSAITPSTPARVPVPAARVAPPPAARVGPPPPGRGTQSTGGRVPQTKTNAGKAVDPVKPPTRESRPPGKTPISQRQKRRR